MVCSHKRKNVITWCHPRLEVKTGLRCHLCPTSAGGTHRKSEPRSVGVLANAHGITLLLQRTKHQNHNSTKSFADGSRVKVFWSPSGTFCPKARGTFPAAYLGASSLCVCCVAMHVLPPKSCEFNATFQVRNVQAAADIMYC